jgi:hypothetical protein
MSRAVGVAEARPDAAAPAGGPPSRRLKPRASNIDDAPHTPPHTRPAATSSRGPTLDDHVSTL